MIAGEALSYKIDSQSAAIPTARSLTIVYATMTDSQHDARLAIEGGQPTFPDGPPVATVAADVEASIRETLARMGEDGTWANYHGEHTDRLIESISNLTQQPNVRLCSSGTIAVELALRGLGISAGDEVILGGYDFPGNFRAIEAVGAKPVLVDLDPETGCVDVQLLSAAHSDTTRCVIVSHLHGGLVPMRATIEWSRANDIVVIEDACQAPGALVDGQPAGSWGDVSVLSFGGSKLLTAGRGGAIACQRPEVLQRIAIWADRGNDAFPMSQLQAATLPAQFAALDRLNQARRKSADVLQKRLCEVDGLQPVWTSNTANQPSGYKFGIWLSTEKFDQHKCDSWIAAAQGEGIAIDRGFRGFTRRSERRCRKVGTLEHARRAAELGVVIHHPVLLHEAAVEPLCSALCRVTANIA